MEFLGFPKYNTKKYQSLVIQEKEILITAQKYKKVKTQLNCFGLNIKKEWTGATFSHSNLGHAKADKPRENIAKNRRLRDGT